MHKFVKSAVRGRIPLICMGYTKANNKFLNYYDASRPTSYFIYLDTDILCGHSIMQLLQTVILRFFNPKDFNLDNYSNECSIGSFLQVDLSYPDEFYQLQIIEDSKFFW